MFRAGDDNFPWGWMRQISGLSFVAAMRGMGGVDVYGWVCGNHWDY